MEQKTRDVVMKEFRSGSSRILITTDLLVRTAAFVASGFFSKVPSPPICRGGEGLKVPW